jgi:hypothetical protein
MLCLLHLGPRFNPLKIDFLLDRLCFHLIILLVVCGSVPLELGVRGRIDRPLELLAVP